VAESAGNQQNRVFSSVDMDVGVDQKNTRCSKLASADGVAENAQAAGNGRKVTGFQGAFGLGRLGEEKTAQGLCRVL
jgi:hypothetical protein